MCEPVDGRKLKLMNQQIEFSVIVLLSIVIVCVLADFQSGIAASAELDTYLVSLCRGSMWKRLDKRGGSCCGELFTPRST